MAGAILVSTFVAVAACTTAPAAGVALAVRDSVGIAIVENAAEAEARAPRWEVASEPRLRIGVVDGAPDYELSHVRGVRSLGEEIAVLNAGSNELRFYDRQGRHLRSIGRQGSGPGEFQMAEMLFRLHGDTLAVYDLQLRRFSFFGETGEFARVVNAHFPGFPIGFFDANRIATEESALAVGLDSPELVVMNR
jgi:hypothetical protein